MLTTKMEIDRRDMSILESNYTRTRDRIPRAVYELTREFILSFLNSGQEITLSELILKAQSDERFHDIMASLSWYLLKVKQDLEAKKIIRIRRAEGTARLQFISLNKPEPRRRLR
jgi:hypothetical protein